MANIYGVQPVKETDVRDGGDIAVATTKGALQAAQMGAKYGPWVAGGAALAGGIYAFTQQKKGQEQEKENLKNDKIHNSYQESLEGRSLREDTMVSAQAKYGMNAKNRYETAEIEGDGSGSADGIGEIHVDKDYNIKNVAKGGKRHEDGGFEINNLEKTDTIFPTQNNEKEFNKVMGAINKWKLRRDPRAKKFLDKTKNSLPTDEDYGYDKKYADGKLGEAAAKKREASKQKFEKVYPGIDFDWYIEHQNNPKNNKDVKSAWAEEADEWKASQWEKENVAKEKFEKINYNGQMIDNDFKLDDIATDLNPYNTMTSLDELNEDAQDDAQDRNRPSSQDYLKASDMTKGMTDAQIEELADGIIKAEETGSFQGKDLSIAEFTADNPYTKAGKIGKIETRDDLIKLLKNHYIPDIKKNLGEDNFNKINTDVLKELTDWNFNSGRSASDVLAYASGEITLDKWNDTGTNPLPKDFENISLDKVAAAKHDGYKTDGYVPGTKTVANPKGTRYTLDNPNPAYDATWKGRIGHTQDAETYKKVTDTYNGVDPQAVANNATTPPTKRFDLTPPGSGADVPIVKATFDNSNGVPYINDPIPESDPTPKTVTNNSDNNVVNQPTNKFADESDFFDYDTEEEQEKTEELEFLQKDDEKVGERYGGEYHLDSAGKKVYTKDLMDQDRLKDKTDKTDPWDEITKMEQYNNPGKYASALNKAYVGNKPIDEVERRYVNSDKYKYEDMSAKDRQANVEQRNYQALSMRGKGLTSGQIQSYGAQNARQYYGNEEGINAREYAKMKGIANENVNISNKDQSTNLALANKYDEQDAMSEAVRQKYKDAAYSDYAKLSQLDEQKKYMMNKDRKMFLRDKATLPFLGTKDMKVTSDGIRYIKDENGNFRAE